MKGLRLYLIISGILVIVYVVAAYHKPTPTDWTPTYLKEHKIPFGTYILHKEIGSIFPNTTVRVSKQPVYNTLKNKSYEHANYLIVAGAIKLDNMDYRELINFMRQGNDVFIAAFDLGKVLKYKLRLKTGFDLDLAGNKNIAINFVNPALKAENPYVFKAELGNQFFSSFDTSRVTVLGRNKNGNVNFIKYEFGKGNLYILPNPRLLTNYSLIKPAGAVYAGKALSYLDPKALLLWDEYQTRGNITDPSILRVVFSHKELRWAYYISLFGILIFVFFEIKRRQRIIPVVEPLLNTSVDFVKVVGRVYYQRRDNKDIARKKVNYFLASIRTNYRLQTANFNDEFLQELIHKSGVQEKVVTELVNMINNLGIGEKVSDQKLIELNKLIEKFYKQTQQ